jgi:Zn-dependent membrane protease YugP
MPFLFNDPTFLLLIPAFLLALYAQWKVSSAYAKYSKIASVQGVTGYKAAEFLLRSNGISDVQVEAVAGRLSDHYDPRARKVRLSEENYNSRSLAALAVAAHEVGHVIQHNKGYALLKLRDSILPATNIGSWAAFPLFLLGFFLYTPLLMDLGIILYAGVVIFHFVTLPVEFNASNRALIMLGDNGLLVQEETAGARKVLNAAALTYVAATAMAMVQLLRLLLLRSSRD